MPWGGWTVAGGMVLWLVSFAGVGFAVVPGAYRALGIDIFSLSPEDKATFTLVCQVVVVGLPQGGKVFRTSRKKCGYSKIR